MLPFFLVFCLRKCSYSEVVQISCKIFSNKFEVFYVWVCNSLEEVYWLYTNSNFT